MLGQQVPLDLLAQNESGKICVVDGDEQAVHRLAEMGLREGIVVRMVKPGSPSILAMGDQRLSLRLGDGVSIFVELVPE